MFGFLDFDKDIDSILIWGAMVRLLNSYHTFCCIFFFAVFFLFFIPCMATSCF